MVKVLRTIALGIAGVFVAIQLVPHGREHSNPPVAREPAWDSPRTRELAERACFDCHSNQVKWPWYSWIAPVSWLVAKDVDEGRRHLNFSEFDRPQKHAHEAAEELAEGEMPLAPYLWLHSEARFTASERDELVRGLEATLPKKAKEGG